MPIRRKGGVNNGKKDAWMRPARLDEATVKWAVAGRL